MATATLVRTERLFRTQPQLGAAATEDPFQKLAAQAKKISENRLSESAFFGQLSGVVQIQNDPLMRDGDFPVDSLAPSQTDLEAPNGAALINGLSAFITLWLTGLLPSAIVPSAEGGVGISLLQGARQAHFEFSNDGEFSLITFEGLGEIEVFSDQPTPESIEAAIQRARVFLAQ